MSRARTGSAIAFLVASVAVSSCQTTTVQPEPQEEEESSVAGPVDVYATVGARWAGEHMIEPLQNAGAVT